MKKIKPLEIYLEKRIKAVIAILVIILGFLFFSSLLFLDISDSKREIVVFILGNVTGYVSLILAYFFGSSDTNEEKKPKPIDGSKDEKL